MLRVQGRKRVVKDGTFYKIQTTKVNLLFSKCIKTKLQLISTKQPNIIKAGINLGIKVLQKLMVK